MKKLDRKPGSNNLLRAFKKPDLRALPKTSVIMTTIQQLGLPQEYWQVRTVCSPAHTVIIQISD